MAKTRRMRWRATAPALVLAAVMAMGAAAPGAALERPAGLSEHGDGEALSDLVPSALGGDADAAYELGRFYSDGDGRIEDVREAARWYLVAAQRGHARAQNDLGLLFAKGQGLPQDYVKAYALFDLAAASFEMGRRRDQAIEMRDMMAAFMTPDERDEAHRLAASWKAEAGY